jgi:hypothetical protein
VQIIPNEGKTELLNKQVKNTSDSESYIVNLFTNDYTPDQYTTALDFVAWASGGGGPRTVARGAWADAYLDGTHAVIESTSNPLAWSVTSGSPTIYGHYVVGASSGKVLWCERWSTPAAPTVGQSLLLTLKFSYDSEF